MTRLAVWTMMLLVYPTVDCFLVSTPEIKPASRVVVCAIVRCKHEGEIADGGNARLQKHSRRWADRRQAFGTSLAALASCFTPRSVFAEDIETSVIEPVNDPPSTPVAETSVVEPVNIPPSRPVNNLAKFSVPYKGKDLPLGKLSGKVFLIVNVKNDDPEALKQYPSLTYLSNKYAKDGLRILAFPTDQGWFEADVSEMVRLRALQNYGFGQFPLSIVFDKMDILGPTSHPLFRYLMSALPNPNGQSSISLNFEKFLLDENGVPLRRYPRKYSGYNMEKDVVALLQDKPLPASTPKLDEAWVDAVREAKKSEYAFRYKYNLYSQESASKDWQGIAAEGFR